MKRILMFCPRFFGYDARIAEALRAAGHSVDLFDERCSDGFVGKSCIRFNVKAYYPVIRRYIKGVIDENRDKQYDCVLVVKGEGITPQAIALLRQAYPGAKFILYLWDSVDNIRDCERRMPLYDRVLTFDPVDARRFNIPFLPIPYGRQYARDSGEEPENYRYDLAFVGTAHSIRPRVVKQVAEECEKNGRTCFTYFYSPHVLVYLFNKLTNPDYRWITRREVHFTPLPEERLLEIYRESRCVLDIEHPGQHGATTRPVEMLPMRKKIITTNTELRDFPFFNENNFCIIDRDDPKIRDSFFEKPYVPTDDEIMRRYSPEAFARAIIAESDG